MSQQKILDQTEPTIINSDNGSEFISAQFKNLLKNRGIEINYVDVGNHTKLGIVDRFVRTLGTKINTYLAMYNTNKYIDVLPKIVKNYNLSYHSGIKKVPAKVKNEDKDVINITNKHYNEAKREEIKFEINDLVRFIKNKEMFQKGTLPTWSIPHRIIDKTEHSYKLNNGKSYMYYLLQKVNEVQKLDKPLQGPTREEIIKDRKAHRNFKKSGLNKADIVETSKRIPKLKDWSKTHLKNT